MVVLSRIIPNLGGPGENKRRMLQSSAHSIILHAAPIWAHRLKVKKYRLLVLLEQRKFALRENFRLDSTDACAVILINLLLKERSLTFNKSQIEKENTREDILTK